MGQYNTNVDSGAIIMESRNKTILVAPDVKHRLVINLVGTWKCLPQLSKVGEPAGLHHAIPMIKAAQRIGMALYKFV